MINCKVFEPRHGFRAHHFIYKETEAKKNFPSYWKFKKKISHFKYFYLIQTFCFDFYLSTSVLRLFPNERILGNNLVNLHETWKLGKLSFELFSFGECRYHQGIFLVKFKCWLLLNQIIFLLLPYFYSHNNFWKIC